MAFMGTKRFKEKKKENTVVVKYVFIVIQIV